MNDQVDASDDTDPTPKVWQLSKNNIEQADRCLFDALEVLRKACWDNFENRRRYEWKVCLALWTALAAFIGVIITKDFHAASSTLPTVIVVCVGIIALQARWLKGIHRANETDKNSAHEIREAMNRLVGFSFSGSLQRDFRTIKRRNAQIWKGLFDVAFHWSSSFQLGVTIVLASAAVGAVATKPTSQIPESEHDVEFQVIRVMDSKDLTDDLLNSAGDQGWHLLHMTQPVGESDSPFLLVWERQRKPSRSR